MKTNQMIILVGLPGSGKSTYAKTEFPRHVRVNQDELKSRDACVFKVKEALEQGQNVIVDRVNYDRHQRKIWINLAKYHGVDEIVCIYLKVPPHICMKRLEVRKDHPTIPLDMPLDKKSNIVYTFKRRLEEPEINEGFVQMVVVDNYDPDEYGVVMA